MTRIRHHLSLWLLDLTLHVIPYPKMRSGLAAAMVAFLEDELARKDA